MGKKNVKIYAYNCYICYGGETRCASGEGERCHCDGYGSRYCYEPKMILELDVGDIKKNNKNNKIIFTGKYNGYGDMILNINKNDLDDYKYKPTDKLIPGKGWTWKEFGLKLEKDGYLAINLNQYDGSVKNNVEVYCNSCY